MLASQLGTRRRTRMVRSGCTVITRVNTKKLGPMMLDTALMPAAVITMAASTNRPDEAVASADAAAAGVRGPSLRRARGSRYASLSRAAIESFSSHGFSPLTSGGLEGSPHREHQYGLSPG